jgi:perosamine synthetase
MQAYEKLEQQFTKKLYEPNSVACSSGTSALHLALECFQLPLGSEVIVPEFSMIACARAVTLAGLVPVFVDCKEDLLMDPMKLQACLTKHTRAIMPVHTYGRVCNMAAINQFAMANNLRVVEDCAEAHGAKLYDQRDARCWSFYQNKIVAGEEGGMVAFGSTAEARLAQSLRCQGFTNAHDFTHLPRGFNARLSNANAKLIISSLRDMKENLARRRALEQRYDKLIPERWLMPPRKVCWVYDLRIPGMLFEEQDRLVTALGQESVSVRHGFKPMSSQPEYRNVDKLTDLTATRLSREVIYLPLSLGPYGSSPATLRKRVGILKRLVREHVATS